MLMSPTSDAEEIWSDPQHRSILRAWKNSWRVHRRQKYDLPASWFVTVATLMYVKLRFISFYISYRKRTF